MNLKRIVINCCSTIFFSFKCRLKKNSFYIWHVLKKLTITIEEKVAGKIKIVNVSQKKEPVNISEPYSSTSNKNNLYGLKEAQRFLLPIFL